MTAITPSAGPGTSSRQLARLVATAAGACSAVVDEHYQLTAIVVERPTAEHETQTVVVEIIHDQSSAEQCWSAMASDELRQIQTPISHGNTAKAAINSIAWSTLDA